MSILLFYTNVPCTTCNVGIIIVLVDEYNSSQEILDSLDNTETFFEFQCIKNILIVA